MSVLGSTNYNFNVHTSIQDNNPSFQNNQLYSKGNVQQLQNQQEFQQQIPNFNKNQSNYHQSKRQAGRSQQLSCSSSGVGEGNNRDIRQKGKSLSNSLSSKSQIFKQYQQYFKSEKYKKIQRIFLQKMYLNLYDKFSQSQNYYYTRDLNDLLQGSRTIFTIKFRDFQVYDEKEEYLKRIYTINEYPQKIKLLTEYYKFHQDIPRLFMNPLCNIINHMHDKKRRIEFYRIAKIIEDENKKNPNKPPKGIVGDIPAAGTEETEQDNNNGKEKIEKGLSNFLKDLSSLTNIANDSKLNINNISKSKIIKNNIAKYSSQDASKIASGIGQALNKQKQQITSYSQKQINEDNGKEKQKQKNQQYKNANLKVSSKINSTSNSMQLSQKVIQDTLLDINYKLNDILQQSSMSMKSEVTIHDMIDNHGLEDFLKFLSKDQNINLMNHSSRNSLKSQEPNNLVGTPNTNLQLNDINFYSNNQKGELQNVLTIAKNGGTINLQNENNKIISKINRTLQSQNSKEEIGLDQIIELKSFQIQAQKHSIQGISMKNNQISDQNSFSDYKKQHISENNSNSTKTSQQNLDKIYSNSKNQQIIKQKINEQIQQQRSSDGLSQNQIKNLKISLQTSPKLVPTTSTVINSTKNQNNHKFDFQLNLKNIQNSNNLNIHVNQDKIKNNFQQSKRLSTGGTTHNESQKILLSNLTKIDNQIDDYPQTSRVSLFSGGNGGAGDQYSQDFIPQQKSGIIVKGQINSQLLNLNTNLIQQPITAQPNFQPYQQILSDSINTKSGYGVPLSSENKEHQALQFFQKTFNSSLNNQNNQNNQNNNVQNCVQQYLIHNNEQNNSNAITQSQFKISKAKKANNPSTSPIQKALDGACPRGDSYGDHESCVQLNNSQQNMVIGTQQQRFSKGKNQSLSSRNQFSYTHGKTISQINTPSNSARNFNPTFNLNINNNVGIQESNKVISLAASTVTSSQNANNFQNLINQNSKVYLNLNDQMYGNIYSQDQKNQIQSIDHLQNQIQIPQSTKENQNYNQLQQQQQQAQIKFHAGQNTQKIKPSFNLKINDPPQGNLLGEFSGQLSNKLSQQSTLPFTQKSTTSRDSSGNQGIKSFSNQQINQNNNQNNPGSLTQRLPIQQTHIRQSSNPNQNNIHVSPNSLLNSQFASSNNGNQNAASGGFNYFNNPISNVNQLIINNLNGQYKIQNNNCDIGNTNTNQHYPVQNQEYFQRNSSIINHPSIQAQQYKEGQLVSPRIENQKQFFGSQQILSVKIQQQQVKKQQHKYTKSDQQQNSNIYQQQFQAQQSQLGSPSNQSSKIVKNIMNPIQQSPNLFPLQSPNQMSLNSSQSNFTFKNIDSVALSSQLTGNNGFHQQSKLQTARQSIQKLPINNSPNQLHQNNALGQSSQTIKMKSISPRKQITIPIKADDKKPIFQ